MSDINRNLYLQANLPTKLYQQFCETVGSVLVVKIIVNYAAEPSTFMTFRYEIGEGESIDRVSMYYTIGDYGEEKKFVLADDFKYLEVNGIKTGIAMTDDPLYLATMDIVTKDDPMFDYYNIRVHRIQRSSPVDHPYLQWDTDPKLYDTFAYELYLRIGDSEPIIIKHTGG